MRRAVARREITPALRSMSAYAPRRRAPRDHARVAADESLCAAPNARREITPALRSMRAYAPRAARPETTPALRPMRAYAPRLARAARSRPRCGR